jgi:acyl transferase domain-containing protein/acyl-CoA synthetase (AMP-forming)/AMP-acid ligase II/acyl carrier protein
LFSFFNFLTCSLRYLFSCFRAAFSSRRFIGLVGICELTVFRLYSYAARLQEKFTPGERAILLYPPGLEFISGFFGCLYAGIIAVPVYPPDPSNMKKSMDKLKGIISNCEPKIALTTKFVMDLGLVDADPALKQMEWLVSDELEQSLAENWHQPDITKEDLAFLQYTSGSTGEPKGVMVSHGNIMYNNRIIENAFGHTDKSVGVSWLPVYHDMGLIGKILQPSYLGTVCILMSPISFLQKPVRWLQAISKYKATTSGGPNFAYELCARKISSKQIKELDLSSWKVAFSGAEQARFETLETFAEMFKFCGFQREAFYSCYGLAEATLAVSGGLKTDPPVIVYIDQTALAQNKMLVCEPKQEGSQAIVGCGRTWLEQKILIVDTESLKECPTDRIGEIWVKGQSVAKGYWNNPELTEKTFNAYLADTCEGPFLRTEDLGFIKDGELFVTGRIKDLIIIRGRNHYPQDIELTVEKSHEAFRKGCCAAFSIEIENEERLAVVQEIKNDLDKDQAIESIRKAIAEDHGLQVHVVCLIEPKTIPKTSSGKIQRIACKEMFLEGSLEQVVDLSGGTKPAALPSLSNDIRTWMTARVAQSAGISAGEIDLEASFSTYGLGSADIMGLSGELGDWLGREISPTLMYDYPSIRKVAEYLTGGNKPVGKQIRAHSNEPVAIVGMSCRFPGADSPEEFWDLLVKGVDAIEEVQPWRWDIDDYYDSRPRPGKMYSKWGGFLDQDQVKGFDADFFGVSPKEAESMDPQQRLVLEVVYEALERGGITMKAIGGTRVGVFVGVSSGDYIHKPDPKNIDPYYGTGISPSVISGRVSYFLDLRGPAVTIDTACSSSLVAAHQACQSLRLGECDLAIAGGVNLVLNPEGNIYFSQLRALSPDGRCKAFDDSADGYVRSEGCGIIVLKRLSDITNGDRVLAVIKGSFVNQDGRSNGITAPNGPSQEAVIRAALDTAGLVPKQVDYVEAHGTGTALGDPIEMGALGAVFEGVSIIVGSVKTNIGHTEAAAGIAGLIKTVLCLQHKQVPPNLHFTEPSPHIFWDEMRVPTELVSLDDNILRAGVSSFGFSGTNAHVVLEGSFKKVSPIAEERSEHLFTLSAKTEGALVDMVRKCVEFLEAHPEIPLADICYTANTRRSIFEHRLAVSTESVEKLVIKLRLFCQEGIVDVAQGRALNKSKTVFVFSGQGSQWLGMGRELLSKEPIFRETIEKIDLLVGQITGWSVTEKLQKGEELEGIGVVQPIVFSIQVALAELWQAYGVKPDMVLGHSFGEISAACVAGILSLEDAACLVCHRSRLISKLSGTGVMVAVGLSVEDCEERLKDYEDLSVAVCSSPNMTVVSGSPRTVKEFVEGLGEEVFRSYINVDVAGHSRHMDRLLPEFLKLIKDINPGVGSIPMFSTVTLDVVDGSEMDPRYWARNLRETVRFSQAIELLIREGFNVFVEISPHPLLILSIREILELKKNLGVVVSSLMRNQPAQEAMLGSLGKLFVSGYPVDFQKLHLRGNLVNLPTYAWQREKYWVDAPLMSFVQASLHPFILRELSLAGSEEVRFEGYLSLEDHPYLKDHQVFDQVVFPGAGFIELILAAGKNYLESDKLSLSEIVIVQALILKEEEVKIQVVLTAVEGLFEFKIYSLSYDQWALHCSGKIEAHQVGDSDSIDISMLCSRCSESFPVSDFYKGFSKVNIHYGPAFQGVKEVWRSSDGTEALGKLILPEGLLDFFEYVLHPALLDAALQVCGLCVPSKETYMPIGVGSIDIYRKLESEMWVYVSSGGSNEDSETVTIEKLQLFTEGGVMVASLGDFLLKKADLGALLCGTDAWRDWVYQIRWIHKERVVEKFFSPVTGTPAHYLVFVDGQGVGKELSQLMRGRSHLCTLIYGGKEYGKIGDREFEINPQDPRDFEKLLEVLKDELIHAVVYMWGMKEFDSPVSVNGNCESILYLMQSLGAEHDENYRLPEFWLVTLSSQSVSGLESIALDQSSLWGMVRVIGLEYPQMGVKMVDLDTGDSTVIAARLFDQIINPDDEDHIAFRGDGLGKRYVARLEKFRMPDAKDVIIDPDAAYLVTGGLGGLGINVALWLSDNGAKYLVLAGRRGLEDNRVAAEIVSKLREKGVKVVVSATDVADRAAVERMLDQIMCPLKGIVHAAGVVKLQKISDIGMRDIEDVLAPKVSGAWNLHELTSGMMLDFFVSFSSCSAIWGSVQQAHYAAANAFLDAFVYYRREQGLPATTINWGAVGGGMVGIEESVALRSIGIRTMPSEQALGALSGALSADLPQAIVTDMDWPLFDGIYQARRPRPLLRNISAGGQTIQGQISQSDILKDLLKVSDGHFNILMTYLKSQVARQLGYRSIEDIDEKKNFFNMGMNSLSAAAIKVSIERDLRISLLQTAVMQYPTIERFVEYLLKKLDL